MEWSTSVVYTAAIGRFRRKTAHRAGCVGMAASSEPDCLMGIILLRPAAEPAAFSARSVGIRNQIAERGNTVEQPLGARWGLYLRLPAPGAGRRGILLSYKRGPLELLAATRTFIFDGWHHVAIAIRPEAVKQMVRACRCPPSNSRKPVYDERKGVFIGSRFKKSRCQWIRPCESSLLCFS